MGDLARKKRDTVTGSPELARSMKFILDGGLDTTGQDANRDLPTPLPLSGEYEGPEDKAVRVANLITAIRRRITRGELRRLYQVAAAKHECPKDLLADCAACKLATELLRATDMLREVLGMAEGRDINLSQPDSKA